MIRIALVAICASKYNYHVIKVASHYAQESRYNNKLPLLDFEYIIAIGEVIGALFDYERDRDLSLSHI